MFTEEYYWVFLKAERNGSFADGNYTNNCIICDLIHYIVSTNILSYAFQSSASFT